MQGKTFFAASTSTERHTGAHSTRKQYQCAVCATRWATVTRPAHAQEHAPVMSAARATQVPTTPAWQSAPCAKALTLRAPKDVRGASSFRTLFARESSSSDDRRKVNIRRSRNKACNRKCRWSSSGCRGGTGLRAKVEGTNRRLQVEGGGVPPTRVQHVSLTAADSSRGPAQNPGTRHQRGATSNRWAGQTDPPS